MSNCWASAISEHAGDILKRRVGSSGRVVSVHANLINIVLEEDELLTIQAEGKVRTPLSLVLRWPEEDAHVISPGDEVLVSKSGDFLYCGVWAINLMNALPFYTRAQLEPQRSWTEALRRLEEHFDRTAERETAYGLIRAMPDRSTRPRQHHYGAMLRQRVGELTAAIKSHNAQKAAWAAGGLIGLGPGLTPAGDDFLQGFLLFSPASEKTGKVARECCRLLQSSGVKDTTLISRAFWRAFFAGHVAEPLRIMVEAFNAGEWEIFSYQVASISRIGHSSGNDCLTGAWCALNLMDEVDDKLRG